MEQLKKIFDSLEIKAAEEDRTVEFIATKEVIDRDGEKLVVAGIDVKNFKKNPVILWGHDRHSPPIGKATKVTRSDDELKVKVQFADAETYPFADTIYKLVKGGFLNAVSIGFLPDYNAITYPRETAGKKQPYRIFNKSELLEVSVVSCPANQEALATGKSLTKAVEEGLITDEEYKEYEEKTSDDAGAVGDAGENRIEELNKEVSELRREMQELRTEMKNALYSKGSENYLDELLGEFAQDFEAQSDLNEGTSGETLTEQDRVDIVNELLN